MAELKPVSDTHAILESMLQKLRLNAQTNSSSVADMQTCSPSGECNAGPAEDSSKPTVYPFGFGSNVKEPDGCTSVSNKWENPWTQQSSHCEDALIPVAKQPVRRISKNNSGFSGKPKRPLLIRGESDNQMPGPEKKQTFSLDGETNSKVPLLYKTESFQNPPDLLAPTLTTSSTVLGKPEVRGQSGTWSWGAAIERNESPRFHEQSGKTTKTSRRKWGDAKRWAQNVKERWRERHRTTQSRQRDDGERQAQNEVQSNRSSLLVPIDVNETPTALTETTDIHHEEISTALDRDGPGSLSYMSESLFSFGTTSNLMEEIFSGTEWAQFLSVNSTKMHQSKELPNTNNQSHEDELQSKWTHEGTTDFPLGSTQLSLPESFAQDMASDKQTETSQMSVTYLPTNPLQTDPFTNQSQNTNLNPNESHNSEQSHGQSHFFQLDPNESKATSSQVSDPSHNLPQDGMEDFIPLLDLSYVKPIKRSSVTSRGSLSRKREHWTKSRESFEHTTQEMEDEENGGSFTTTQLSSNSLHSPSPTSSLDSMNSISQDSETSETLETANKKRRMEDTRHVRFSEEVIILPPTYWPESDDDDEDEEEENDDNDDNDLQEEPSPRHSFPKWIVSLKPKSGKYKF
ncbi:uncharacterized protein zgc:113229 [Carassius carassius]|uniref:uncharacterized protein zgc:113229 n=1 Tax=Carassius carassius TaxID=217509 RepID=UPI0028691ADC|nr:uncharacterized protein zgc:113229 [Carassius carassius]XP_059372354.1 uncharacterized protein zgc:113229 [Carassius carassius]XP_059372355.1 uncharacterized protein zgc:113229 [Carassius carassius]